MFLVEMLALVFTRQRPDSRLDVFKRCVTPLVTKMNFRHVFFKPWDRLHWLVCKKHNRTPFQRTFLKNDSRSLFELLKSWTCLTFWNIIPVLKSLGLENLFKRVNNKRNYFWYQVHHPRDGSTRVEVMHDSLPKVVEETARVLDALYKIIDRGQFKRAVSSSVFM